MAYAYELETIRHLPKQAWLHDAAEQNRFRDITMKWRKENPKASMVQQMLFESLVRVHLMEQRLVDKKRFWNGEPTDYRVLPGRKQADVSSEDQERLDSEFAKWFPSVLKWKTDLLKLALAEKIELTGDLDIASLVSAYQGKTGENGTGERSNHTKRGSRIP